LYLPVFLIDADVQILAHVVLQGFVESFGQVQPEAYVFVAGFPVILGFANPPAYAGQGSPTIKVEGLRLVAGFLPV
jgi:hypothetical protein